MGNVDLDLDTYHAKKDFYEYGPWTLLNVAAVATKAI
jgi:hypothetical protein